MKEIYQELQERRISSIQYYKDWPNTGEEIYVPTRHGDIRCLLYKPSIGSTRVLPVVFNLHGGGMVVHKAEMDQPFCEKIRAMGIIAISIDYSLAPEAPWPQQIEEAYDVISYFWKNAQTFYIDPSRMAIAGHSAGGYLAISVGVLAKQEKSFPMKCQILDYPWVDLETPLDARFQGVAAEMMEDIAFFKKCYYTPDMKGHLLGSPLWLKDIFFQNMPPTILTLCEYDILQGEDLDLLQKMVRNGTEVTAKLFKGVQHGFTCDFYYLPEAQEAHQFMLENLNRYL